VPGGAWPSYAHGYYERNKRFYKAWDEISRNRETFLAWMKRHVLETHDFGEFRQVLELSFGSQAAA
jgi:glutaconate CoA-transferase subunit A